MQITQRTPPALYAAFHAWQGATLSYYMRTSTRTWRAWHRHMPPLADTAQVHAPQHATPRRASLAGD
jgi:hypothetical protein